MTARICLLLLCGLPGSGKSTIASLIKHNALENIVVFGALSEIIAEKKQFDKNDPLLVYHVEYDNFYDQLAKCKNSSEECKFNNIIWKLSREMAVKEVINLIETSSEGFKIIIIDDNMYYYSMRHFYYKLAQQYNCAFIILEIRAPFHIVHQRNKGRRNEVAENIINQMWNKFEFPNPANSAEKHCIVVENCTPRDEIFR
jgi:tRNA uridine 5-carbamoylmethylation protein Kti12